MIAHIKGKVVEKFGSSVIVDVAGVGYEIALSALDFEEVQLLEERKFYTYHKISETSEDLYGFSTLAAKKIFELLISVNGVGPKAAMAILSLAAPEEVRNAIANGDAAFVSKAAGVGKKSAERVIVDLRDKVGLPSHYGATEVVAPGGATDEHDEALDALMALGFPLKEATEALAGVDKNLPTEQRIKAALSK
ncbi:Holliday junction branch migration protein RuvA [Candidatus Saccharibacteria bacterium]|nr:Holliday junction branch migration protein RuvA [Candidatus Saccharibacteria bacterium]